MSYKIYTLALRFRKAIEKTRDKGELDIDSTLKFFIRACCNSASSLLAKLDTTLEIRLFQGWFSV